MVDREKVIRNLEELLVFSRYNDSVEWNPYNDTKTLEGALALLKAQKTSLETVAEDHGLTPDGVSFALDQYQTVISEITHGMMSKLTYSAKDVLQTAQERWCDTCELMKAQEPVEPVADIDTWKCGNCGHALEHQHLLGDDVPFYEQYNYCPECGRAVKWDG